MTGSFPLNLKVEHMDSKQESKNSFDKPYPLKQKFYKIVVPGFIVMAIVIVIALSQTGKFLIQEAYLNISENRSSIIDRALKHETSDSWKELQTSTQPQNFYKTPKGQKLLNALRDEVGELGLSQLKIYGKDALVLYSSNEIQIGTFDPSPGYEDAVNGKHSLVEKDTALGTLYELYVKVPNNPYPTVMELYEPVSYLNKLLISTLTPIVVFMLFTLGVILWLMRKLVIYAQNDIVYRTNIILDYKERLQQLVSREAVNTLRSNKINDPVNPKIVTVTILFSDIRGFTDYCDNKSPEKIVSFLNQLLGIQIQAIEQYQGDIDKIIGDAVFAFFQGDNSESLAFAAAHDILLNLSKKNYSRGVGIGIYTGEVIIGTIGGSSRKDFTVIGDAVNIASRLCSEAKENEIVIDIETYAAVSKEKIEMESLQLKGKSQPINVHRIKLNSVFQEFSDHY